MLRWRAFPCHAVAWACKTNAQTHTPQIHLFALIYVDVRMRKLAIGIRLEFPSHLEVRELYRVYCAGGFCR